MYLNYESNWFENLLNVKQIYTQFFPISNLYSLDNKVATPHQHVYKNKELL